MELEMTEKVIRLCQGSLEIAVEESGEGAGERSFVATITLPVAEQHTVLVIDDNADTRRLFEQYLSGSPYRSISTDNAQSGLALAREFAPHVTILHPSMPAEHGGARLRHSP